MLGRQRQGPAQSTAGRNGGRKRYARPTLLLVIAALSLYPLLPSLVAVFASWRSLSRLDWAFAVLVPVCELTSLAFLWQLDRIALRRHGWFAVAAAQLSGNAVVTGPADLARRHHAHQPAHLRRRPTPPRRLRRPALPPAATARFSTGITLFGTTLPVAAEIGIVCAFGALFLGLAIAGFGRPE